MTNSDIILRVGDGAHPVVIIDDFHPDFTRLKQSAAGVKFTKLGPFYPGLQAQADPRHLQAVHSTLKNVLRTVFGIERGVKLIQCSYSIVTTAEADLLPIQRLPHVDTTDPGRIALLHYLSEEETGGTAFYRHRGTRNEVLNDQDFDAYSRALEAEGPPKPGYMRGSDDRFELIGHVAAKPNRAVLYRSQLLHSGMIPSNLSSQEDSGCQRLTLNSFFQETR
ncbi:hypothetical protein GCM10009069_28490 [Algimonas arctica]|uniref:Uncharacterized protein n=1 Tax=Algimonas arctica TaxID=1479486 RepID=A0A8J3G3C6_9PROT|nr:DUF6445 family protein [Algimonas arctica]GHB04245.1 hypothetical protein GCM10009069_28490 [Algimonas arctica]